MSTGVRIRACALSTGLCIAAFAGDEPYFRTMPPAPGYYGAGPWGISADGMVVVGVSAVEGGMLQGHSFRWNADRGMEILGSLYDDWNSQAYAASSDGSVVVGEAAIPGGLEAFVWTEREGMLGLGDLAGGVHESTALGVSADGTVVVGWGTIDGDAGDFYSRAFLWTREDGMMDLGTVPGGLTSYANAISSDGRVVVGGGANAQGRPEAFRWTEREGMIGLGDLPGGSFYSMAVAASADGSVIVGRSSTDIGQEAFRWTEAEGMLGLGRLDGLHSVASAVSANGAVVVGEADTGGRGRPFIWTAADGMRNLEDVIRFELGLDLLEFGELIGARAISADGRTIAGWGFTMSGDPEGWVLYMGPGCRADFDIDGSVDTRDVTAYLNAWVQRSMLADWNYDATVDIRDIVGFLNEWVEGC